MDCKKILKKGWNDKNLKVKNTNWMSQNSSAIVEYDNDEIVAQIN